MTVLTIINKQTGALEIIKQQDLERVDWGFHFFVANEIEAYKAAYVYRNSPNGVKVEFAGGVQRWMVTVFNEQAAASKLDGAKMAA